MTTIPSYSIKELFEANDQYIIPVYQRNYAWGLGEVKQLIEDIHDYAKDSNRSETPYYIGSLVVYERKEDNKIIYETIDGQQRLTTLVLLLNALHRLNAVHWNNEEENGKTALNMRLKFFSRPKSETTLNTIGQNLAEPVNFINSIEYNNNIKDRYHDTEKVLKELLKEPKEAAKFYKYLINKVHLIRVSVPEETDLNHYFEIMNNRGEQLEKHEVLKSMLLSHFKEDKQGLSVFHRIWDAVSDMERYVQYGFTVKERDALFGKGENETEHWNHLKCNNFTSFKETLNILRENTHDKPNGETLDNIESIIDFKGDFAKNTNQQEDAPDRFTSVVNFQGFLLHVLRVQTQKDIHLDDKRLIISFKDNLKSKEDVEDFAFNLLRCKHLFDQYIVKREFISNRDQWSLKKLKRYDGNMVGYVNTFEHDGNEQAKTLMLLSMFHVTLPSMNYKHWLSAALNYLFKQNHNQIDATDYANYLFMIAQSYFYDRIVIPEAKEELDYYEMIFDGDYKNNLPRIEKSNWRNLDKGTGVENFAFNFLDYLLWLENRTSFEFTFRSSVEHYYPQNPIDGKKLDNQEALDSFGNLCLISSSKNSRLSNNLPMAKKDHYNSVGTDSLKLRKMMESTKENTPWDENAIHLHREEMIEILERNK